MADGQPWQDGISCGMCLSEDPATLFYPDPFIPETWFCRECWERCQRQQAMIDEELEQNPEIEN
jgi:hypothetical protein